MDDSRYIAIFITENYNRTVWTKTEYKKALAREQKEGRTVMLPLIVGEAELPEFIEDKIYIDMRKDYFDGITQLIGMAHDLSKYRISRALSDHKPEGVRDVWKLLQAIDFEPYVVLGNEDFDEIIEHGGQLIRDDYGRFYPDDLLESPEVSSHVKSILRNLL